jgi:uncharacterized protein DUF5335
LHDSCLFPRRDIAVSALRHSLGMRTEEIARSDWERSLDAFSAVHEGWLVSLQVLSPELGAQPVITDLPLVGVTLDDEQAQGIAIAAERSAGEHATHFVAAPTHVWVERTEEGADVALEIESSDGSRTLLSLKTPARPETVDGLPGPQSPRP